MFGIGLLLIVSLFVWFLVAISKHLKSWKAKIAFWTLIVGGFFAYPNSYKWSSSYATFQRLCDQQDRYRVIKTQPVQFLHVSDQYSDKCEDGAKIIGSALYAGFDCTLGRDEKRTVTRYTKKADWRDGCGLECFSASKTDAPEHLHGTNSRNGFIDMNGAPILFASLDTEYSSDRYQAERLHFSDTVHIAVIERASSLEIRDFIRDLQGYGSIQKGTEMAYRRSYTYYPYGNGWAKILGAASGSAPTLNCKTLAKEINLLDIYPPK